MSATVNIPYYTTERGLLVGLEPDYRRTNDAERHRINGQPLIATFNPKWWLVDAAAPVTSYAVHAGTRAINARYEIRNPDLRLPPVIAAAEIEKNSSHDWSGTHAGMEALYQYKCEYEDLGFAETAFTAEPLGRLTFDNLGDPTAFSYKIEREGMFNRDMPQPSIDYMDIFADRNWGPIISVDEIHKAMKPEFAWHLGPCSVNSRVAYRLIRFHVKGNVDPRYAEITSDYDFCFTVKKRIRVEPYTRRYETPFSTRRRPKFRTDTVQFHLHEFFEMTHAEEKYKGYTVVEGFSGTSLTDLADNIDHYLRCLTEAINEPLARCPTCQGTAVVNLGKIPTNDRERFGKMVTA